MTPEELDNIHESITEERMRPLAEAQMFGLENPGVCLACGEERDGCEPDAEHYACESCDKNMVMGATELYMVVA